MILVVDAINREKFGTVLDKMFELRARVFGDRLGWKVKVENGRERDLFDDLDPVYVIALDDDYNVVGCNRMLQTTGPHMLADVFQDILCGEPPLRSATVWENTRFCIDTERLRRPDASRSVAYTACELMSGITEYALASGITDLVNVIDPVMDRVLRRYDNAPYDYIGQTVEMGKTKAMAALGDITDERVARIRKCADITGDIFADEDEVAQAIATRQAAAVLPDDLHTYFNEQIAAAETEEERLAALRLRAALADQFKAHARSAN